jgi:putative spermidine/putrescine transport system permease protein
MDEGIRPHHQVLRSVVKSTAAPFLLPILLLSFGGFIVPMGVLAAYSLSAGPNPGFFGNYTAFLADPFNMAVIFDTITLGLKVVLVSTCCGIPIAMLYWHGGRRLRQVVIILTLFPMLTSDIVRTFAWVVLLGRGGPLVTIGSLLGITSRSATFLQTEGGMLVALAQINLPLMLLPVMAVLSKVDGRLVEAAEMAGAGKWRIMATILLPLALPGLIAGWILTFASASTSLVTQASIGGARLIYLPLFVYRQVNILFDWPTAAAVSFILVLSTGSVILALAMLTRHPRLVGHV